MSAPLFYVGLAGVPTNIERWWHLLHVVNSHPYVSHSVSLLTACGLAFYDPIKNLLTPVVSVSLLPTSGRSEMELRVTNLGKRREFFAQCEPVSLRYSPNPLHRVTYSLKWDRGNEKRLFLSQGESANLMIAKSKQDHKSAFAEMELLSLYGEEAKQYEWAGWSMNSKEVLPEYDLKISVFGDGTKKPLERVYTLRPERFYGPLVMAETDVKA